VLPKGDHLDSAPATLTTRLRPKLRLYRLNIGYPCHGIARVTDSFLACPLSCLASERRTHQGPRQGLYWRGGDFALRLAIPGTVVGRRPTLDDLYEITLNPDGGFRSEQMEAIAKLAEKATGCLGE
jgi:hypothetical protein